MTVHNLKSWPVNFWPVVNRLKRCELRLDDRGYKVGDVLLLNEFIPKGEVYLKGDAYYESQGEFTGESIYVEVTHIDETKIAGTWETGPFKWVILSIKVRRNAYGQSKPSRPLKRKTSKALVSEIKTLTKVKRPANAV